MFPKFLPGEGRDFVCGKIHKTPPVYGRGRGARNQNCSKYAMRLSVLGCVLNSELKKEKMPLVRA